MTLLEIDEPEIQQGTRAWYKTQELFRGTPDPTRRNWRLPCSWYDNSLSEYEGAFCLVQASKPELDELIGEIVLVTWRNKSAYLYCVGGDDLDTDFAITRWAWFRGFTDLSIDEIVVRVHPVNIGP